MLVAAKFLVVASLDRKRLGKGLRVGRGGRSEAFSIKASENPGAIQRRIPGRQPCLPPFCAIKVW